MDKIILVLSSIFALLVTGSVFADYTIINDSSESVLISYQLKSTSKPVSVTIPGKDSSQLNEFVIQKAPESGESLVITTATTDKSGKSLLGQCSIYMAGFAVISDHGMQNKHLTCAGGI